MNGLHMLAAVAGAMLLAAVPAAARPSAERLELRCEIALAYAEGMIARYSGSRLVFSAERPDLLDLLDSGWWAHDADPPAGVAAPAELVDRLPDEGRASAMRHCAALRGRLAARGIAWGRRAVRAVLNAPRRERDRTGIVIVSLPVVSDDGRRAILAASHSGAGASLQLLERQSDGSWRAVARKPLAIY